MVVINNKDVLYIEYHCGPDIEYKIAFPLAEVREAVKKGQEVRFDCKNGRTIIVKIYDPDTKIHMEDKVYSGAEFLKFFDTGESFVNNLLVNGECQNRLEQAAMLVRFLRKEHGFKWINGRVYLNKDTEDKIIAVVACNYELLTRFFDADQHVQLAQERPVYFIRQTKARCFTNPLCGDSCGCRLDGEQSCLCRGKCLDDSGETETDIINKSDSYESMVDNYLNSYMCLWFRWSFERGPFCFLANPWFPKNFCKQ